MTTEQINKAAEEYANSVAFRIQRDGSTEIYDEKLHDAALRHFQAGANFALSQSRQEIEKANEQLRIQQECTNRSEANLRESIHSALKEIEELKAENEKLREALKAKEHISEQDDNEEIDAPDEPCSVCGEVNGMVNPCCPNYDPLHYKNCGYG